METIRPAAVLRLYHTQITDAVPKEDAEKIAPARGEEEHNGRCQICTEYQQRPAVYVCRQPQQSRTRKASTMPRRRYDSARETNRPGREAKQSSARAPRSFARVVSPPRRMLHTDAAAVWRLTDTSRRYNTTGAGERGQYRHTDKSPARMGAPRGEAIPYAPPQIWTTRTIRTTSERERTARVSHSKRRTPQSLNTAKGRKAPPARKKYTRRGRAILFVSKEGEQKR